MSRPEQRVQNYLAIVVVTPVVMEMATGEAKSATTIGSFDRPHHGFGSPLVGFDM